jgi:5'-phosphate synthase pdxT subunit
VARVGILALQGDFAAHARSLGALDAETVEVRRVRELTGLDGLVIPGGESTTLLNLMQDEPWFDALRRFHETGGALLGTCAGAILLAREVTGPAQPSLGLLDVVVQRNAFGRQVDSFEDEIELVDSRETIHAVFIRAPRFRETGPGVEILASWRGEPVLVRQGRVMAATFHPELTEERRLHGLFLDLVEEPRTGSMEDVSATPAPDLVTTERRATC